jgi:hypothetical protein
MEVPNEEPVFPAPAIEEVQKPRGLLDGLLGGGRRRDNPPGGSLLGNLAGGDPLGGIAGLLRSGGGGISKILKNFSIEWDSGDILLALILLFLSLESDDDEILILLGLMLVIGF